MVVLELKLLLAVAIVVVDQITKFVIMQKFVLHETLYVTSFFNLVRVHNTGAALVLLTLVATLVHLHKARRQLD